MGRILFAAVGAFVSLCAAQTQPSIAIRESAIRASLKDNATAVTIPVESSFDREVGATLSLEWVETDDHVSSSASRHVSIPAGKTGMEAPFPLTAGSIWTRLRYSLIPDRNDARSFRPQAGIVPFSHIAPHAFELKVSHAGSAQRGRPITVTAQAIHPVTRIAVPGVEWEATLNVDDQEIQPVRAEKHDEGFVEFTFDVPVASGDEPEGGATVEITATRGDFDQHVTLNIPLPNRLSGRFQTDKPIYQPGQTIHLRALITGPQGRAAGGAKVTLRVDDQDNERLHTASLAASRFGVVQEDWALPATVALGEYQITLTAEGDDNYRIASHMIRISRYELPSFNVAVKTDRTAYLRDQQAELTITGSYLFGKPVPKGRVKIVRTGEPRWNPKTRKSEPDDQTVAEGEAAADGIFVAQLDSKTWPQDILQYDRERFEDLHFAAYYTDPSSNRTEQRRFDIRITREPIHVYLIPSFNGDMYVSTSYADGRPATTAVDILFHGETTRLRTNQYGVGKTYLPRHEGKQEEVEVHAVDSNSQTGTWKETYWPGSADLRMETSRTLHHAGESVTLQISASPEDPADQFVTVRAIAGERAVASRIVRLVNRTGVVTFPYQPDFRRTVVFVAWRSRTDTQYGFSGSQAVIYPDGSDIHVSATAAHATYKPGENAELRMQVNAADGRPVEAALGLAVVDQAVLERARTDSDFGHRSWFACAFCRDDGETEIGGVRLNDLYALKASAPITPDLNLAAEALLAHAGAFVNGAGSESLAQMPVFFTITSQMGKIKSALDEHYASSFEFPQDVNALARILGPQNSDAQDPWGNLYRPEFSVEGTENIITMVSCGPDKQRGTADDFVAGTFRRAYFTPAHLLIDQILKAQPDYPATDSEFKELLREQGLLLDSLHDPWGTPFESHVTTRGVLRYISISSAGPDRTFGTTDDISVTTFSGSYFTRETRAIWQAILTSVPPPQTDEEFQHVLQVAGVDLSKSRDVWDHPYLLTNAISSRYSDRLNATTVQVFGAPAVPRMDVTPVTQRFITFYLRSAGADGLPDTFDDFEIARFPILLDEQSAAAGDTRSQAAAALNGTGAIAGVVLDPAGAVVGGVMVTLFDAAKQAYETTAAADGTYYFGSLPAGGYSLRFSIAGFKNYIEEQVPVRAGTTTKSDITLEVGSFSESVTITAQEAPLQTETAQVSTAGPVATPRVRSYFPETLLWLPEIVTDARGSALTRFKLADTVTTWKVAVIASTIDGRVAEAESDLRAFQPFFLDFSPPPVLTDGDQIDLPVTVRNYQDRTLKVDVSLQPNDWSEVQGSSNRAVTVSSNDSVDLTYTVRAKSAKDNALQQVVALAGRNHDAIEKSTRVHPDGQEITQTKGDLIFGRTSFSIPIPTTAISGATRAELRIYPNIASLLLESASTILIEPHGCAEQTISAGYANLVALRFARSAGIADPKIEKIALANIRHAQEALGGFQDYEGGVAYWATGKSDVAVTAYALNFLVEASEVVPVDREKMQSLVRWLQKAQTGDGTWKTPLTRPEIGTRQKVLLASLVAKALAAAQHAGLEVKATTLAGAYHHIAQFTDQLDEPYMLAQFILAALDSGDETLLGNAATRLRELGRDEKGGLYWDLQTNSPFYAWGMTGRLETTGLAVSALSAWSARHAQSSEIEPAIRRGLVFLLRERDKRGTWYSTQSTVRAMRALADASAFLGNFGVGSLGASGGPIEIHVNGRLVKTVSMPKDPRATDPVLVDLSAVLSGGENQIEILALTGALMRLTSTHWIPWPQTKLRNSPELRLAVQFDRLDARPGEPVRCSVKAERIGFRGYGMMLAEIGMPPGAEVDRASLEALVDSYAVDQYDVLPDRVIVYLWPQAGGASFDFYLRIRMPIAAKSAAAILYDYYNSEALSEVAPVRWQMK